MMLLSYERENGGYWLQLDFGSAYALVNYVNDAVPEEHRDWSSKREAWWIADEYMPAMTTVFPEIAAAPEIAALLESKKGKE